MKLYLWILIVVFILIILRLSIRGYFWRDKKGNKLSFKEFSRRFKEGVSGITPLQSTKTQLMGIWITLSGIIAGIVINALTRIKFQWVWIEIVLSGSFILVIMNFISTLQKYWKFRTIDKEIRKIGKRI